jgi:hypothetical protein
MIIPGIHPPDPKDPRGMAWAFAAGFVDPRPGGYPKNTYPNQVLALKESWEPTSQMFWDLGFRYHPELATKWIEGGGQFTCARIVDEPPVEQSIQELAEEMAKDQYEQMVAEVERVKEHGSPFEKKRLLQRFQQAGEQAQQMAQMLESAVDNEIEVQRAEKKKG